MKKFALILSVVAMASFCGSADKRLKPGETKPILDTAGNPVGVYNQLSETTSVTKFDSNNDQKPDKAVYLAAGQTTKVEFYKEDGITVAKTVTYENGKAKRIQFFADDGTTVTKDGVIENNELISLDVLAKKKRIYYKADGSIDRVEDLP